MGYGIPIIKKKVLLIGGLGYIGSKLYQDYKDDYDVDIVDNELFGNPLKYPNMNCDYGDSRKLSKTFFKSYDVIILLAGHSSVKMAEGTALSSFNNNVVKFLELMDKLNMNQKFIYASSSSVYGSVGGKKVNEEYYRFEPYNYYDISKHIIDLYAVKSDLQYYGLRFGTANGYSPLTRTDVMINAMTDSALNIGEIKLYIKDTMRPILGLNDLSGAIRSIIENGDIGKRGLYNLASFNKTAEQIANGVSNVLGIKVKEYEADPTQVANTKLQTKSYNFAIDCEKFEYTFKFRFEETVESITMGLRDNWENIVKVRRDEFVML